MMMESCLWKMRTTPEREADPPVVTQLGGSNVEDSLCFAPSIIHICLPCPQIWVLGFSVEYFLQPIQCHVIS